MDDKKIAALLETVEQGSFNKAAEKLGYTQSGLNRMINALEKEVGFPLLSRDFQGISFNENGKLLAPYLKMFVDSGRNLYRAADRVRNNTSRSIRIGSAPSIGALLLSDAISSWQSLHPDIKIQHAIYSSDTYVHVMNGDLDFAIVDKLYAGPCEQKPLVTDEMYAVLPDDSPYLKQPYITLEQLAELRIIISEHHPVPPSLKTLSAEQDILISSSDAHSIMVMVKHGLGATVLSSMYEPNCIDGIRMIPLKPAFYRHIVLIARSFQGLNAASRNLVEHLLRSINFRET